MKNFSHAINVTNNNNYIISHTESNWSHLRPNSLISIDDDRHFYTIGQIEEVNFIVDFKYDNYCILDGEHEELFLMNDILTISYKEYQISTIIDIISGGQRYQIGDLLSIDGLTLSIDVFDNKKETFLTKVEEVDGNGAITKLSIVNKGKYINSASTEQSLTGGKGNGAKISCLFTALSNRKMIERQNIEAINKNGHTYITLSDKLPMGVTEGKLSFNKHKAYLTSTYIGSTKRNSKYHISRDYTPFLNLPLLAKNSNKNEEFYNHAILEIDKKLRDMQAQIDILKSK